MRRRLCTLLLIGAGALCVGTVSARSGRELAGAQARAQGPAAQVARGRQLVLTHACGDCHGGFGNPAAPGWLDGVRVPEQELKVGPFTTRPRNLTPDNLTGTGRWSERQIFNALRFGLRPADTPDVVITGTKPGEGNFPANPKYLAPAMPWSAWRHMADQDLLDIAAYLKRGLKPVEHKVADSEGPPDFWASESTAAKMGSYPAAKYPTANETSPPAATPASAAMVARGRYSVISHDCGGCHGGGADPAAEGFLSGVRTPEQEFKIGPFKTRPRNITPDNLTGIGRFSERQIFNSLRFGLRPGETPDVVITGTTPGKGNFPANPKFLAPPMPWPTWRHMSDDELWAIAAYLKRGVKPVANKVADSEGPPDFWASEYTAAKMGPHPAAKYPTANEK